MRHRNYWFDIYHYKYDSGHEGDMCKVGFSLRKQNISLYLMSALQENDKLLEKPGKHKPAKAAFTYRAWMILTQ